MPLIPDFIEGRVFAELCSHCPYAKECHENAETCDEYNDLCHFYMKENEKLEEK